MPDNSLTSFSDFINHDLDLSGLDAPPLFSEDDITQLLSAELYAETLRIVRREMRDPDGLPLKFSAFNREALFHLSTIVGKILRARYPERLDQDEWRDAAALAVALAWLVRAQLDSDDPTV
ncbi:MAG: hypothetical protein J0M07_12205 [Anaerolineae bacterium]|jgi:hypothetical protein|uniref:hypothetical protein n=1 Tax=Candidatus Flexifilum breve TaxID=3140694 RepID=UPI001AC20DD2|nr:hypothetical protein [Chloroflexota bacterium]MBK9749133.1 hypothetical protein [Chloroflexota bacterium]MBN8636080.1 hypothetical protein [Anaerolineae bacterium]